MLNRTRVIIFACLSVLPVLGLHCKSNSIDSTTNNNNTDVVEQIVGPAGATVIGPDKSQVVIPAGALDTDTTIKITRLSTPPSPLSAGWTALGKTYAFEPHNQPFKVDVTITVPYAIASQRLALAVSEPTSAWSLVTGDVSPTAVTVGSGHFSFYQVVDPGVALDGGADSGDAAPDCAALLAQRLAAPITPPNKFAGYDLSSGKDPRGLSIDEANEGCLQAVNETVPSNPGLRIMQQTPDIQLSYVLDSRIIDLVSLGGAYTGTLTFNARPGGIYYGTSGHSYVVKIGSAITRDGSAFGPADWSTPRVDGGPKQASAWLNEIFDGIVYTFHIGFAQQQECLSSGSICLVNAGVGTGSSIFGIRSIGFYLVFDEGTNVVRSIYEFYTPATPNCMTPMARQEQEDYAAINPALHPGPGSIGGVNIATPSSNMAGMTKDEANALLCNGQVVASPPDPAYGALQWGPQGEVLLEYNLSTNVAYKMFAQAGYKGTMALDMPSTTVDGGNDHYVFGVPPNNVTKNGTQFTINWASANAAVTELSNAVLANYPPFGGPDADCVVANDCTITVDDGKGHSVIGFTKANVFIAFQQGTSTVQQVYIVWPGGM